MLTGQIFIQLIIILIVVQVFGYLCQFIGQPRVIGEILAGLALGPTLLGALLPHVETTVFTTNALPTVAKKYVLADQSKVWLLLSTQAKHVFWWQCGMQRHSFDPAIDEHLS